MNAFDLALRYYLTGKPVIEGMKRDTKNDAIIKAMFSKEHTELVGYA